MIRVILVTVLENGSVFRRRVCEFKFTIRVCESDWMVRLCAVVYNVLSLCSFKQGQTTVELLGCSLCQPDSNNCALYSIYLHWNYLRYIKPKSFTFQCLVVTKGQTYLSKPQLKAVVTTRL